MDPKYEQICKELKEEFPAFKVVPKETSRIMRLLYCVLLMSIWNKLFMDRCSIVLGSTVYMPMDMIGTSAGYRILRADRIRMRDSKGLRSLYYYASYFMLPIGPSFRACWELKTTREVMLVYLEEFGVVPTDNAVEFWAEGFYGKSNLWMWPFKNHIRGILYRYRDELTNGKRP